jgi:hypothetical protein
MQELKQQRAAALKEWVSKRGGITAVLAQVIPDKESKDFLSKRAHYGECVKSGFLESAAANWEELFAPLGMQEGTLMRPSAMQNDSIGRLADPDAATSLAQNLSHPQGQHSMTAPVLTGSIQGDELTRSNDAWPASERKPYQAKQATSGRVKFVEILDDAMSPRLRAGDLVLIDPDGQPERGKTALFLFPDGGYAVRFYEPLSGGGFEARDEAGRTYDSARHEITYAGRYVLMMREGE